MRNKDVIGMATAVVAFVCANADTNDAWMASIRMDHPRMFFNADTWPQVKARAEGPARAERDALLKRCDGYPENPKCSGTESATLSAKFKNSASSMPIPAVKEWGPQAAELEDAPVHARHFPSAGQFYMRSGWKGGATYATFTATVQPQRGLCLD